MAKPRNILWIMCDQLRYDYLSCYGHKTLHTPNIDALATRGVRFTNSYVQSTICGPSRMSAYTGRYVRSHGSTYNGIPLRIGEPTLGDHLRDAGMRTVLIGKTHMTADTEGMERLGIDPNSIIGVHSAQCGFEPFERDDGLHPSDGPHEAPEYNRYLAEKGYTGESPWESWANAAEAPNGEVLNGWLWTHADKPARVAEEDSETPYMTRRAMDFMAQAQADGRPWCAHLSYIKPHWPYLVPAPYHDMYGLEDIPPVVRNQAELDNGHPIFRAFTEEKHSQNFARPGAREKVIPAYMGLIKQIDDQLGLLFSFMEDRGMMQDTMIVFTSDHGDYLGDHWLGEKYLFHDVSAKVPMIIVDPDPAADKTRGQVSERLVEMIDLAPTFLEVADGEAKPHVLEGTSLLPVLHGQKAAEKTYVFSEFDYAPETARYKLEVPVQNSRMVMVFDGRFKLVECRGFRPMLFDLQTDPDELTDLGDHPDFVAERARLLAAIHSWYQDARTRITKRDDSFTRDDALRAEGGDPTLRSGIIIGYWDEDELKAEQDRIARFDQG
ncbi:phosphonate monoester hydrolase [Ruegeria sp. ANG-R]|uniref:sulfatase-like hydrolase/transferase n=1 Tax=Ruegeria sp. ANG-R TaxID=1577903 RepID=UPI00057E8163|nr:sulfatase-like hydrolase/transferase [Ruegeria sp. ANG-R]KIC39088.1 phosphonate monoester hydrolase [Ruegeria sp. ANG-R]